MTLLPRGANAGITFEHNVISPLPKPATRAGQRARLRIELALGDSGDARSQLVFLQAPLAVYPGRLDAVLVTPTASPGLGYDWNLGCVRVAARRAQPGLRLLTVDGRELARWSSFVSPAELGMTLRRQLGTPSPVAAGSGACVAGAR